MTSRLEVVTKQMSAISFLETAKRNAFQIKTEVQYLHVIGRKPNVFPVQQTSIMIISLEKNHKRVFGLFFLTYSKSGILKLNPIMRKNIMLFFFILRIILYAE